MLGGLALAFAQLLVQGERLGMERVERVAGRDGVQSSSTTASTPAGLPAALAAAMRSRKSVSLPGEARTGPPPGEVATPSNAGERVPTLVGLYT